MPYCAPGACLTITKLAACELELQPAPPIVDAGRGTLKVYLRSDRKAYPIQVESLNEGDPSIMIASYNLKEPGDYIIRINWAKTDILGSPFRVHISDKPIDNKFDNFAR